MGSDKTWYNSMTKICDWTPWHKFRDSPSPRASRPGVARCSLRLQTFAHPFSFLLLVINHRRMGLQFNVTEVVSRYLHCHGIVSAFILGPLILLIILYNHIFCQTYFILLICILMFGDVWWSFTCHWIKCSIFKA